jgi:hypothetical protein
MWVSAFSLAFIPVLFWTAAGWAALTGSKGEGMGALAFAAMVSLAAVTTAVAGALWALTWVFGRRLLHGRTAAGFPILAVWWIPTVVLGIWGPRQLVPVTLVGALCWSVTVWQARRVSDAADCFR